MERIGVFVCHCGTNIAGTVDCAKVAEELAKVDGVVYSTHYTYMCSSAGQQMIEEHIKNDKLTGVVLCSCSPRMHEKTFRACAERAKGDAGCLYAQCTVYELSFHCNSL